ncbi:MAG: PH domain-containing protein [Bacteroidota bacterium]
MVYKSKISPALFILVVVLIGGLSVVYIIDHVWVGLTINLFVGGFIAPMFLMTNYTINGNTLNVRCGFFYNTDIDISSVRSIVETNSVLSAPALSFDRIEIFYNRYDSIVISPPHKMDFITHLKSINDNIEVKLKEKKISK